MRGLFAGRRLGGLGVSLTADEQQAQQRSFGLSKSLADVGAQNMAGAITRQRQQQILGNPAPTAASTANADTVKGVSIACVNVSLS